MDINIESKPKNIICTTCREMKTIDDFRKDSRVSSGLAMPCKECISKKRRERYAKYGY